MVRSQIASGSTCQKPISSASMTLLAAALRRLAPPPWRHLVWPAAAALAATRILLRAHYPSDVAAGLALGAGLDRLLRQQRIRLPSEWIASAAGR